MADELKIRISTQLSDEGLQRLKQELADRQKQLIDLKTKFGTKSEWVKSEQKGLIDLKNEINNYTKNLSEKKRQEAAEVKRLAQEKAQAEKKALVEIQNAERQKAAEVKKIQQEQAAEQRKIIVQQRADSKYKGQSTVLGSPDAIKQQIKYWSEFRNTLTATDPRLAGVNAKIIGLKGSMSQFGSTVKASKFQLLEFGENLTVVTAGITYAVSRLWSFASSMINVANEIQAANLGLQSIAKFKGIDPVETVNTVNNLDLVKNGLLSVGDASLALKNLLATGFSLPQAIELIKRFGDSAAFGRQSSLEFGYAIVSATEGLKNQNSILVDNAGVTKNISVIMKEAGMTMEDLSDETKKGEALTALYNGILRETTGQLGDASKLTETFAGKQAQLNQKIKESKGEIGEAFQRMLLPVLEDLNKNYSKVNEESEDLNTQLDRTGKTFAFIAESGTPLMMILKGIEAGFGAITGATKDVNVEMQKTAETTKSFTDRVFGLYDSIKNLLNIYGKFTGVDYGVTYGPEPAPKKTSTGTGRSRLTKDSEKQYETTDKILKLEKELENLEVDKTYYIGKYGADSLVYLDTLKEIAKIEKEIAELRAPPLVKLTEIIPKMAGILEGTELKELRDQIVILSETDKLIYPLADAFNSLGDAISHFFETLATGDASGYKQVLKNVLMMMLDFIQLQYIGASASAILQAVLTAGFSAFKDLPQLAAATVLIQALKGAVQGLAKGGQAEGGTPYIVGERGRELFIPNQSGYVMNNKNLEMALAGAGGSPNIYINANMKGIEFLKEAFPQYINYTKFKRI